MPETHANRRAPLRRRLILSAGATLIALLAAEIGCRVLVHLGNADTLQHAFTEQKPWEEGRRVAMIDVIRLTPDDSIIFELKPDLPGVTFKGATLSTNSLGFRSPEVPYEADPDTITIVGLGDSVMFGYGVPDGADYMARLEDVLNRRHPERRWRCINTAVPMYNTVQEVQTLRTKALAFEPDLVILGVVSNDLGLPPYVRLEDDPLDLSRSFLWERCVRGTRWAAQRNGFLMEPGRDPRLLQHGGYDDESEIPPRHRQLVGLENFHRALDELDALSREHGFLVVTFANIEDGVVQRLVSGAAQHGWEHVSLMPDIQAYLAENGGGSFSDEDPSAYLESRLAVSPPVDGHPSELQHHMAAHRLYLDLQARGVLARLMGE